MTNVRSWRRMSWLLQPPHLTSLTVLLATLILPVVSAAGEVDLKANGVPGQPSACEAARLEAQGWTGRFIETHGRLPEYSEIVELPRSIARWVVLGLPAPQQHAFWQSHMKTFLAAPLNDDQRDALRRASALLTRDTFERSEREGAAAVHGDVRDAHAILASAFDERTVAQIVSLAPGGSEKPGPLPEALFCGCNLAFPSDCAEGWPLWTCAEGGCDVRNSGCGDFLVYPCNGQCCRFGWPHCGAS